MLYLSYPNVIIIQIRQHFKDGHLHKDEFNKVYVAPMKVEIMLLFDRGVSFMPKFLFFTLNLEALAAEVTRAFSNRLAPLSMVVRELTGDMQLSKSELEETQVCHN